MSYPKLTAFAFMIMMLVAAAVPASAQDAGIKPQSQGAVTWVSGGVGQDETDALQSMQSQYNLHLLFALQGSGEYLSNVAVRITNAKGDTVLDTIAQGPKLFAKMPAGSYKITASFAGKAMNRAVSVPAAGSTSQSFYWTGE